MSLTILLVWAAVISFFGHLVWRVPLWVPVGALVALKVLQYYPVK